MPPFLLFTKCVFCKELVTIQALNRERSDPGEDADMIHPPGRMKLKQAFVGYKLFETHARGSLDWRNGR